MCGEDALKYHKGKFGVLFFVVHASVFVFFLKLRVSLEIPEKCHILKCYFNELSGNDVTVETV